VRRCAGLREVRAAETPGISAEAARRFSEETGVRLTV